MSHLADTNILSSLAKRQSSQYAEVRRALTVLRHRGEEICLVAQNLIEFWAIATRPTNANGLGLSITKTFHEVRKFKRYFTFYGDVPNIFAEWEDLVFKHQVSGKNVHDARLVAAMLAHSITHLLTFNVKDFKRFHEIIVVDPHNIK